MTRFNGTLAALTSAILLFGSSCGGDTKDAAKPNPNNGPALESVGLSEAALDRSVDPCVDFYQYACGGWLKATKIPGDQSRWGRFNEIQKRNQEELKRLLEEASKGDNKAGKFYASCMDEAAIEKTADSAIKGYVMTAGSLATKQDLVKVVSSLHAYGFDAMFGISVESDFKDPNLNIAYFDQGGLGLPDRSYYLGKEPRMMTIRVAYVAHVQRMFQLVGVDEADAKVAAANVMKVETAIAKLHKTRLELHNIKGMYNPISRDDLSKSSKSFDWNAYLTAIGYTDLKHMSLSTPNVFKGMDALIAGQELVAWKAYLQWRVMDSAGKSLSKKFVDEKFKMTQALTGQKVTKARWKTCIAATTGAVRDEVAKLFISTMFAGESKKAAEGLVHAISNAFAANVSGYDWMDPKTKAKALEKRKMMAYLIGYPNKWREYNFAIDPGNYFENVMNARKASQTFTLNKADKAMDREEWGMSASTVNAYYHPLKNHMVYPAAILQPPFYSVKASPTVNLGSMGMIVGHELTHGFDDQGSQFSATGKLENWWQPEDAKKFNAKKQCLVDKYNSYEILPGLKINGKLTLGENIADLGGVKLAYQAYRKLRGANKSTVAGGFNQDQQFFLAVGQAWCNVSTEKRTRMLIKVDPHSPGKFRVNGSLQSLPEFAKAFSCKAATPMNPANRCTVW